MVARPPRRNLRVEDVTRHLAFAFNSFLERQAAAETPTTPDAEEGSSGMSEDKKEKLKQVQENLKEIFDLPDDDSLKVTKYIIFDSRKMLLMCLDAFRQDLAFPKVDSNFRYNFYTYAFWSRKICIWTIFINSLDGSFWETL